MAKIIAVTGKGGTGKTVVAALIIRYLKQHAAGPLLAIDADPDTNLSTVLGVPLEQTIGDLREETLEEIKRLPPGISKLDYIEAGLHQIIVETEKVDFVTMGRAEGPGCYCFINSLLRKFSDDLQGSYEWVVMDNEAGLEHLNRRTAAKVDHLVVVVNDSPLSLDTGRRIDKLLSELRYDVGHRYVLINNVAQTGRLEAIRQRLGGLALEYLGEIPHDEDLENQVFRGESLYKLDASPAVVKMEQIMGRLYG